MCGLAGIWPTAHLPADVLKNAALTMAGALAHRGPDDEGIWVDVEAGLAIAHRRLSILDLSPAGHQPMTSATTRFVLAYNGEIYNHLELRRQLEAAGQAPAWRGHSDTETLLAGFQAWGVRATLGRAVGMFGIVLWDRERRQLHLARDRMGEKPLYFGWNGADFVFASELKAIRRLPGLRFEVDRRALVLFFRYSCVPAPYSIYRGVYKLRPGALLTLCAQGRSGDPWQVDGPPLSAFQSPGLSIEPYWFLGDAAIAGTNDPFRGSEEEAAEELDRAIRESATMQQLADVPVGAFLSGGVDSSVVVAAMQSVSDRPVRTFTIGFREDKYDEARYARAVADWLGTQHSELYVSVDDARAVIPKLAEIYDEPFADSSQIPTYLIAKLARRDVTVALSGDGGDELFGGYPRYLWSARVWTGMTGVPGIVRSAVGSSIRSVPTAVWDIAYGAIGNLLPSSYRTANAGSKLHKLSSALRAERVQDLYRHFLTHWASEKALVIGADEAPVLLTTEEWTPRLPAPELDMMYADSVGYLPDDILVKVDRAAMAVSLETRLPLLDHRVVELAWRLPLEMKIRGGETKRILKKILQRYVPKEMIDRPKMGFGIPVDEWLKGPLRSWAERLLDASRLQREGYLHAAPIRRKWRQFLDGKGHWQYELWDVLMFQSWLEHWQHS
jgi:asparagine synthase (glutamine-hydrolysing)